MKVLVTGAAGFVGKNLVENLRTLMDGRNKTRPSLHIEAIYEYDQNNTAEDLDRFCQDCDFVFNLAGVNRPQDPKETSEDNDKLSLYGVTYRPTAPRKGRMVTHLFSCLNIRGCRKYNN